jgi:phosphate transport system protein
MLKKLFQEWRSVDLMQSALDEMSQMIDLAQEMITGAIRELTEATPLPFDVAAKDRELNLMQVEIRRKIIRHLHINPRQDVLACVTLLHVVIYVERLGDYAKNIHEAATVLKGTPFDRIAESDALLELSRQVLNIMTIARDALSSENVTHAKRILEAHHQISEGARGVINRLIRQEHPEGSYATMATMYARYLKRISGHLMNAASTVINAFDQIGFYPEKDGKGPGDDE